MEDNFFKERAERGISLSHHRSACHQSLLEYKTTKPGPRFTRKRTIQFLILIAKQTKHQQYTLLHDNKTSNDISLDYILRYIHTFLSTYVDKQKYNRRCKFTFPPRNKDSAINRLIRLAVTSGLMDSYWKNLPFHNSQKIGRCYTKIFLSLRCT